MKRFVLTMFAVGTVLAASTAPAAAPARSVTFAVDATIANVAPVLPCLAQPGAYDFEAHFGGTILSEEFARKQRVQRIRVNVVLDLLVTSQSSGLTYTGSVRIRDAVRVSPARTDGVHASTPQDIEVVVTGSDGSRARLVVPDVQWIIEPEGGPGAVTWQASADLRCAP